MRLRSVKAQFDRWSLGPWLAVMVALCFAGASCRKVALTDSHGRFSVASAHWFQNEGVAYVFFALDEQESRLLDPVWELRYVTDDGSGGLVEHDFTEIRFETGVHHHEVVHCGGARRCASYSFRVDQKLVAATIRFRYDRGSSEGVTAEMSVASHLAGDTADAYSALIYGVFDQANEHIAVKVHHNFGVPSHETIASFGLKRRFRVTEITLDDSDATAVRDHATKVGSELAFPASFCKGSAPPSETLAFAGTGAWLDGTYDREDPRPGACFTVEFLDVTDQALGGMKTKAHALRNPELKPVALTFRTPLVAVEQIPVRIEVCSDDPGRSGMTDQAFLDYQAYVLGMRGRAVDVCYHVGDSAGFRTELDSHLAARLAAAKAASDGRRDFMFVVLFHNRFNQEFQSTHAALAQGLNALVGSEALNASPRLVGAFVYDTMVHFKPTAKQSDVVMWCPQELAPQIGNTMPDFGRQNCTTSRAFELDLEVVNFVAPLGPFPSLDSYNEYKRRFGDAGIARSPKLTLSSVPTTENTVQERSDKVTYFDGERYVINDGEAVRFCAERADSDSAQYRFRLASSDPDEPSLDAQNVNAVWLSDDAPGEYRIGIAWEFPFFGVVRYDGALNGKVASIVPFTRSFRQYQQLGERKWQTETWDFGQYVEHCRAFCDHPVFDEGGVYQPTSNWRELGRFDCPARRYPVWKEGVG